MRTWCHVAVILLGALVVVILYSALWAAGIGFIVACGAAVVALVFGSNPAEWAQTGGTAGAFVVFLIEFFGRIGKGWVTFEDTMQKLRRDQL